MVHRFQSFEIDEAAREVRAGARALPLQPLVFDLLLYLAKNRGRVVSKDELLETIWPDVTVADGSLQRAVSLARAALAEAGATDVIRTHARRGYRFCDHDAEGEDRPPAERADDAIAVERAHAAYARRNWLEAIVAWEQVDRLEALSAYDLQQWAHAAHHAGRSRHAIAPLEAPLVAAQTRCRLAALLAAEGDRESSALEMAAAVAVFRRAGANGLLAQCDRSR